VRRTGAKASGFATATPRQDGVARETESRAREYWNDGIMEGWRKRNPSRPPFTKGRRPIGMVEGWKTEGINVNREPANARDGF